MSRRATHLLADASLEGMEYLRAHAAGADAFFAELMAAATDDTTGVALLAVGGYGRRELWPFSDLDVLLLHHPDREIDKLAEALWYPVWDLGFKLGHSAATLDEAMEAAEQELERATAYLDVRLISGDAELAAQFVAGRDALWQRCGQDFLGRLATVVAQRHEQEGDVAFHLEPNLKQGRGGLRDVHCLSWAERAVPGFAEDLLNELAPDAEFLAAVRVELHRARGRAGDVLNLEEHDTVARAMGFADSDRFTARLSQAGRRIGWNSDQAWARWERRCNPPPRSENPVFFEPGIVLVGGQIEIEPGYDVDADPLLLLRAAAAAAMTDTPMSRQTLERLRAGTARLPEPWPDAARHLFEAMFLAGRPAIGVVEDLDHFDLMIRLVPEWAQVSCRPQRNVLHTFTVDRHLCEAAANAAAMIDRVDRPELLVVGTLLHDIGKGYPGDHTEVGMPIIGAIAQRMGYPPDDVAVLVDLCRYHLLLPDVATRRDLADPGTIRAVAAAVDTVAFLRMLAALTEADSLATGPSAWGSWKAGLLEDLVERTAHVLSGGRLEALTTDFPTPEVLGLMDRGERSIQGTKSTLTVVAPDATGLFSRVAGALAVCGLEVLEAVAMTDNKMAATRFVVQTSTGVAVDWPRVLDLVDRAVEGRLALTARIAQRARNQARYRRRLSASPPRLDVNIDNDISDVATVVDVHAADSVGLLYRITRALAELDLNIHQAKVQTLGPDAVDSFYLNGPDGKKVTDRELLAELALAVAEATLDTEPGS